MVGGVGNGWAVAITTLMNERAGLGAGRGRGVRMGLEELKQLAHERGVDQDPVIRQRLAQLEIEVELLRLNSWRGLTQIMKRGVPGPEGSLPKWQWGEINQALTELAVDILGEEGAYWDSPWTYRLLRSRANSIEGGTTEILKNIIAERVLGLPKLEGKRMNFDFSDDQQAIKRTAKDLLADRFKLERVRELAEAGTYDEEAWKELCELGWPGIFVDEQYGGQGLGIVELIILMEELGYTLAPVPFLSNAAAGLMIQAAGSDEQKQRWLPGIASGEARGAAGLVRGDEAKLVPDGDNAEVIVLCADGGVSVVERSAADVEPVATMDSTRRYARVHAGGGEPLPGEVGPGIGAGLLAVSAELTGVAQRAMEMAVEYARDRKQFGRPIGAYQAVSHRCAQMLLETEGARSATYYGAWTADAQPEELELAASMAKAYSSDAGWRVCSSSLQVHGGIGFTWEHDLHFFLKRAKVDALLWGSASEHRERVADVSAVGEAAAV